MTSTARPSVAQCSIWAVTERCVLFASSFARASSLSEIFTGAGIALTLLVQRLR